MGSSVRSPSSWLIVGGGFVAYLGLAVLLDMVRLAPQASLPWWVAQPVPPVLYALVVFAIARPRSWLHLLGGTALLWVVHMLAGMVAGALVGVLQPPGGGAAWAFPPSPMPGLLWVPLLLIPLRDVLGGDSRRRRRPMRRPETERRTPVAPISPVTGRLPVEKPALFAPSRGLSATPVISMNVRYDAGRRPGASAPGAVANRSEEAASSEAAGAPRARPETKAAPEASHAQRLLDDLLSRERSDEPIRVSFRRVAPQLPAEAFSAPLDLVAAALEEPGHLLVPRRLALAQLPDGVVRAGWDVVAGQFPRHLLAASDEDIKDRLPGGHLVLPLDEVVRQFPTEIFLPAGPAPNVQGIEVFPAPFQPISAVDGLQAPPASIDSPPEARITPPREAADLEHGEQPPLPSPSIPSLPTLERIVDASAAPEKPVEPHPEPTPVIEEEDITPARTDTRAEAGTEDLETEPLSLVDTTPGSIGPAGEASVTGLLSASLQSEKEAFAGPAEQVLAPAVPEPRQGPDPARIPCLDALAVPALLSRDASSERGDLHAARALAARVAPPGASAVSSRIVDGVNLFAVTSVGLGEDPASTAARLILPLLADGRAPWPIDQVTLRGPHSALVLTLLGPLATGGPVLAATVPAGRSLALLEIRCHEASTGYAARADVGPAHPLAPSGERDEPNLLDVEPSTRTREVAASLGALGRVTASALRDAESDHALYLFLPPGSDVRLVGAFASDLSHAMRAAAAGGVVWSVAILRSGARRLVIRLPGASGRSHTIVAAGETARPGLAYRQVEHAAATLGAL